MKISTKGRYSLKAAGILAESYGEGPMNVKAISEKGNISESYLEQLLSSLRKSDIIETVRGAQGGYLLKKQPSEITVGDVLRAAEGDISPTECTSDGFQNDCVNDCITKKVWEKLKLGIDGVVDSITIEDLINKEKL
ncbi:MAG: RrF2 family transcriptional regulator [Tissierellia bacterium]|nr:RrF2 family transcriptional regulator [Tissierellia bacterium]